MEEEEQEAARKRKSRFKLVTLMVVLVVVGVALWAMPIFLYPDNIVHTDTLTDANMHTTSAQLTLDEGNYEVWMTTSIWSWMYLDLPVVYVNNTDGQQVSVDTVLGGDDRSIEGDDCRLFATFTIDEKGTYNLSATAGLMAVGMPGSERLYVVEERPSTYAPMQWAGIAIILAGIIGATIVLFLMAMDSSERKKRQNPPPQPPAPYPPPPYPPYPPQQQPPYGQYPPPQQPPPYPPPQQPQPYPPPQQPPLYPPPQQGPSRHQRPPPY